MEFELGQNINENKFEEHFFEAVTAWFSNRDFHESIKVDRGRTILKDISFVYNQNGEPRMVWGFSETDIVFYVNLPRELFVDSLINVDGIQLQRLGRQDDGKTRNIAHPLVILELKSNNFDADSNRCYGTNTHNLNTYSRKAGEWKELFPNLKCFLVFNVRKVGSLQSVRNPREKVLRHVRNFDNVFELGRVVKRERGGDWEIITAWEDGNGEEQLKRLFTDIEHHLNSIENQSYILP